MLNIILNISMQASTLININAKKLVYVDKSNIDSAGNGLFAKRFIHPDTPVVIYHGDKVDDEVMFDMYIKDPSYYHEIKKYIRGTNNGFAIDGSTIIKSSDKCLSDKCLSDKCLSDKDNITNPNLFGVYVNDIGSITCKKEHIDKNILISYVQTKNKCNLKTVDTEDYPVYVSTSRIKKGEELYVHYGIGNWLSFIGCDPLEISKLNKQYDFSSFY
jgi:hypothetical protein